jgi:hypothetical protein
MSTNLKVDENLEGQLGNLALQDFEVNSIDQHSGAGAGMDQHSSSKVSLIFCLIFFGLLWCDSL